MCSVKKIQPELEKPRCSLCLFTKGLGQKCCCDYSKYEPEGDHEEVDMKSDEKDSSMCLEPCFKEPRVPTYGPEAYEEIELSFNNTGCSIRIVHDKHQVEVTDGGQADLTNGEETKLMGDTKNRGAQVDSKILEQTMMDVGKKRIEMCYKGCNELDSDIFVVKLNSKGASETKRKTMEIEMKTPKYVCPSKNPKESCGTQTRDEELDGVVGGRGKGKECKKAKKGKKGKKGKK